MDKHYIIKLEGFGFGGSPIETQWGSSFIADPTLPFVPFKVWVTERGGTSEDKLESRFFTTPGRAKGAFTARTKTYFRESEAAARQYYDLHVKRNPHIHPSSCKWITSMEIEEVVDVVSILNLKVI